ncbi:MAG: ABC transporter permease subunit [Eubacteriales bacterium]
MERKNNSKRRAVAFLDLLKPYIYLFPALGVIVVFFLGGFILALIQSLGYFPAIGLDDFTLNYYKEVLSDPQFLESLGYTLYIAAVSTAISTVLGTILAYALLKTSLKNSIISFLYKIPIAVPHLVAALMIVFILSQGGVMARFFIKTGLITETADFPAFFFTRNALGIIIIYVWKEIPFVAFMVYAVMKNIHRNLGEVASTLNASERQVFCHVILPLSMPSIISASVIVFAFSFGAFEIPYLLGVTYPKTMSVWAYYSYISSDLMERPVAMVINIVISLICSCLVLIYYLSTKKYLRRWD